MLGKVVILTLCLIGINASGEFSVLHSPDSVEFKGHEKLESESVGDVISAALGYWVDDGTKWSGLYINNPFKLPTSAVVVLVSGVDHINLNTKATTYTTIGGSAEDSLNALSSELETSNLVVSNLDFSQLSDALDTVKDIFGQSLGQVTTVKTTNSLKPELHSEDKEFLTQVGYINKLAEIYESATKLPSLLVIRLGLDPIRKAHGCNSAAMVDALKLLSNAIENLSQAALKASDGNGLFVTITEKAEPVRSKRNVIETGSDQAKKLNLAMYYDENYPVIFNIILWFMVVFGLTLLAICYAIASMDPGRDSIIYRMTSTRMKKDN